MKKLSDMPNIGKNLEATLEGAGIRTPLELIHAGSQNALLRIREIDNTACYNMLCALEGAIMGIRWHDLPPGRKEELKSFMRLKEIPFSPLKQKS